MSLRRLVLRDFVIVQELELEFVQGFSVLTGETGAGKSILIDALELALGARAEASLVRQGADCAEIIAEFSSPSAEPITLRRSIDAQGRSRAWINGALATATQLRQLAPSLVDIHGQHAWQSLMSTHTTRQLLDAYGGISTQNVQSAWEGWRTSQQALEQAQSTSTQLQEEQERLVWQIETLEKLNPAPDEWEALNQEHTRLQHAHSLLEAAQQSALCLEGGSEQGSDVIPALHKAQQLLDAHSRVEPNFAPIIEELASSLAQVQDALRSLLRYSQNIELDPERLSALDERLAQWLHLARRYHCAPQELPDKLTQWRDQLEQLQQQGDLPELERACSEAQAVYEQEAAALSNQRKTAAGALSAVITEAMQSLAMPNGVFAVELRPLPSAGAFGWDEVVFLVAAHAGGVLRPIAKVASGGELSRLSLAIAVATSAVGQAQTLIFDEVDAGIGGAAAHNVGRLMRSLGRSQQVLAVTHLPQVAACADHHYIVTKDASTSSVHLASTQAQREEELARMLTGQTFSATSLAHAREMLLQGSPPNQQNDKTTDNKQQTKELHCVD